MQKKISLNICANEGRVTDALRQLANYIEECNKMPSQFESDICCAEITEE